VVVLTCGKPVITPDKLMADFVSDEPAEPLVFDQRRSLTLTRSNTMNPDL
jgi:hypothetical protein